MGDETTNRSADHIASPQRSYGPSSSVHKQEVSYSYSPVPGNTSLAFGFLLHQSNLM